MTKISIIGVALALACLSTLPAFAQPMPQCLSPGRLVRNGLGMSECRCPNGSVPNWPLERCTQKGKTRDTGERATRQGVVREQVVIDGKRTRSFHVDLSGKRYLLDDEIGDDVRVTPLARDHVLLESMLGMEFGTLYKSLVIRRSTGMQNGVALIRDGKRWIVYDPEYYDQGPAFAGRVLLLGHEVGHHFCEHRGYSDDSAANWRQELQADGVAGSIVARMEQDDAWAKIDLNDVLDFAAHVYSEQGGPTHPPRNLRIEAIVKGYRNGSPCKSSF